MNSSFFNLLILLLARPNCGKPSASPSVSPSPSPSPSSSGGCFLGNTPVTLEDGSVKQTQDLAPGDVLATPAGPSEVLLISQEMVSTPLFTMNEVNTPWVTGEHPFPKYGITSYDYDNAGWYSFINAQASVTWPWLVGRLDAIEVGSSMIKFDATTNTTSEVLITSVTGPVAHSGAVYTYTAWPLNSPTRVPNSYMIGYGYVAYSFSQPFISAAGMANSMIRAAQIAYPVLANYASWLTPGQKIKLSCWLQGVAAVHGPYLTATITTAYQTQNPGHLVPTSPPAGYDGPASEFISWLHDFYAAQGRRKRMHQSTGRFWDIWEHEALEERTIPPSFITSILYQFAMAVVYEKNAVWLDWVPYSAANNTINAALDSFNTYINSYDYTSIAQSCVV